MTDEDPHRPFRALVGQAIQSWMTRPEHGGESVMDDGIVSAWAAVAEVMAPDGQRHLVRLSGTGVDGDDHTTAWQRNGMYVVAMDDAQWGVATEDSP